MLQDQDYNNIFGPPLIDPMRQALQKLKLNFGTLALTASHQLVLFFKGEEKQEFLAALANTVRRWVYPCYSISQHEF